jgi:hypothetical protein
MRNLENFKTHEQAALAQAQAQASLEMAIAIRMKAQSLQDIMAQRLSGTNIAEISDCMAHEYYALRGGELLKLEKRLQEP